MLKEIKFLQRLLVKRLEKLLKISEVCQEILKWTHQTVTPLTLTLSWLELLKPLLQKNELSDRYSRNFDTAMVINNRNISTYKCNFYVQFC
jgi:hypothetical protein